MAWNHISLFGDSGGETTVGPVQVLDWNAERDGDPTLLSSYPGTLVGNASYSSGSPNYVQLTPASTSQTGWLYFDMIDTIEDAIVEFGYTATSGSSTPADGVGCTMLLSSAPTASDNPMSGISGTVNFTLDHYKGGTAPPDPLKIHDGTTQIASNNTNFDLYPGASDVIVRVLCWKRGNELHVEATSKGTDFGENTYIISNLTGLSGRYIGVGGRTGDSYADHRLHYVRITKL